MSQWQRDHRTFVRVRATKRGVWYLCWEDEHRKRHRRGPFATRRDAELAGIELAFPLGQSENRRVFDVHPCSLGANAWASGKGRTRGTRVR